MHIVNRHLNPYSRYNYLYIKMKAIITLDIGGTNIRCALFHTERKEPIFIDKISTVAEGKSPIERIIQIIEKNWPKDCNVAGIAVAAPGSVDVIQNKVILAPNIAGWENIKLGDILQKHFKVKVLINNDARLAAIGEWKRGAGRGHDDLLYFTISTGLGGGVITGGKILQGAVGIATEVGHIVLQDDGPKCGCGKLGHLEAFSSGTGIQNFVREKIHEGYPTKLKIKNPTTKEIARAAHAGDQLSLMAFQRAGYYLGIGVANYLHIFNPSCVIFGGGVSQSGDLFLKTFRESLEQHVLNPNYLQNLKIALAELGDNAGLIGAFEYMKQDLH